MKNPNKKFPFIINTGSAVNRTLLKNFTSLTILQISNYLFPLITFPYLVRVLGPDKFGLVNFAAAFVGYFSIITDYGFNLSATREVSIHRNDKKKLTEIYCSVLIIKFSLFVISTLIIYILVSAIPKFQIEYLTYFISFGIVFGNVLFPIWFFQGVENMKYITILNIIFKAVATIFIFLLVTSQNDYNVLVLLNSLSFIGIGIASLIIIRVYFGIGIIFPSKNEILFQLKEGWYIFISTIAISGYTVSNTFILGLFTNNTVVGYFVAADKLRFILQNFLSTVTKTVYPHLSKLFRESLNEGLSFVRKLLIRFGTISFIACLVIFIFAGKFVDIVLGDQYSHSIIILRIISFLPFIIVLSNIAGVQTMLNLNFKKDFAKILIISSLINLVLSFILVPIFYEIGTSVVLLFTEFLVTSLMFISLFRKKINLLKTEYV